MDQQAREQPTEFFYFMGAVQATYVRNVDGVDQPKQRTLNVLLQAESANLTKSDLNTLNRSAIQRVCNEHEITPDAVKDVVFLNIVMLGYMAPDAFENIGATPEEKAPA